MRRKREKSLLQINEILLVEMAMGGGKSDEMRNFELLKRKLLV